MQTLCLLPGLLCDRYVFETQILARWRRSLSVQVADFRGHNSISSMAESVLAMAPERFALAGHSMGGRVALEVMRTSRNALNAWRQLDTGAAPARDSEAPAAAAVGGPRPCGRHDPHWRRRLPPMVHPARLLIRR
jgi:pimeloyl-ACP methyl ester carboxylesterase